MVKWPDAAPSGRSTGRMPLVLVGTVSVILALRHQVPSTHLDLPAPTARPLSGTKDDRDHRVGPQGEEEGGWWGPGRRESGSIENQQGKLEAAKASSPLARSVIS